MRDTFSVPFILSCIKPYPVEPLVTPISGRPQGHVDCKTNLEGNLPQESLLMFNNYKNAQVSLCLLEVYL